MHLQPVQRGALLRQAAAHVDAHWHKHRNQALAVLKSIRETDASGASVGDPVVWTRMVEASIADAEDDGE